MMTVCVTLSELVSSFHSESEFYQTVPISHNSLGCIRMSEHTVLVGQLDRLMRPLEPQITPQTAKIPSRSLAFPELCPRKFLTCRSSLWALPASPHASRM